MYFKINFDNNRDTGIVSFGYALPSAKDSIVKIPLSIIGQVVKTDRPCKILVADSSTAIVGKHYDALPDTFKIHAGRTSDTLRLKVYRTADLQTKPVRIVLYIVSNEYFNTDMQSRVTNVLTGASFSYVRYRIELNELLKKPK